MNTEIEDRKLIQQLRDAAVDLTAAFNEWYGVHLGEKTNENPYKEIIAAADASLAQPKPPVQSYDEWIREALELVTHISELHSRYDRYGTKGLHDAWTGKRHELRAHLRNHPAVVPEGFVLVPVEPKQTIEQNYALMEAHAISAADEFFSARSSIDSPHMRKIYDSAFQRAWSEAMIAAPKAWKDGV